MAGFVRGNSETKKKKKGDLYAHEILNKRLGFSDIFTYEDFYAVFCCTLDSEQESALSAGGGHGFSDSIFASTDELHK